MDNTVIREARLQEIVNKSLVNEVTYVSFNNRPPKLWQIGNTFDKIKELVYNGGALCFYPSLCEDEVQTIKEILHSRLIGSFDEGFAFASSSMAALVNLPTSRKPAAAELDVVLLIPGRPGCVFTVVTSDINPRIKRHALQYVLSLVKGIVKSVRTLSDEQFSVVYGLINETDLSSDDTFQKALHKLEDNTARLSVPITLTMSIEKNRKIVHSFLLSLSITTCVSDDDTDSRWCLTPAQFRILMEHIGDKNVSVAAWPHCGRNVLMMEVACRLEKLGTTTLVTKSEDILRIAKRRQLCSFILTPEEYSQKNNDTINVVSDCKDNLLSIQVKGSLWSFTVVEARDSPGALDEEQNVEECSVQNEGFVIRSLSLRNNDTLIALLPQEITYGGHCLEEHTATTKPLLPGSLPPQKKLQVSVKKETNEYSDYLQQRQINERTKGDTERYTKNMVQLEIFESILSRLNSDRFLTVTGQQGEGKTTLGFMVLQKYIERGWNAYAIKTPREYYCIHKFENSVLLFNDPFGALYFDENEFGKWIKVLGDLNRTLLHPSHTSTVALFVSRDDILQKAMQKLEKFAHLMFHKSKVLNLSHDSNVTTNDKKKMFNEYQRKFSKGMDLSDHEIDRLINESFPYGFAYCCHLFFHLDSGDDPFSFFRNPQAFLYSATEARFQTNDYERAAFHLLVYGEGRFDVSKLFVKYVFSREQREIVNVLQGMTQLPVQIPVDQLGFHFMKMQEAFQSLTGLFVKKQNEFFTFSNTSVYECVANIMCQKNIKFITDHCHLNSLEYFIHFNENGEAFSRLNVRLPTGCMCLLVDRLIFELNKGHLSSVLSQSLFTSDEGVSLFLSNIDLSKAVEMHDVESSHSFCYLASSNGKDKLLSQMIHTVPFTKGMVLDAMYGCCAVGNIAGMIVIQRYMKENFPKIATKLCENFLKLAIENGHSQVAQKLITEMDMHESHSFDYCESFILAAEKRMKETVKLLLGSGVLVNTTDANDWTALHHFCHYGYEEMAILLVLRGCKINSPDKDGKTPLHLAVKGAHLQLMKSLRQWGAVVNAQTKDGETLLHTAVASGNIIVVKEVLTYGISVFQRTILKGETALHIAVACNFCNIVKLLLQYRWLSLMKDKGGNTVLHVAARCGFAPLLKIMMLSMNSFERYLTINTRNSVGCSVMHVATLNGDVQIVDFLTKFVCDIDARGPHGLSPLCTALQKNCNHEICEVLLVQGANVNHVCKDGSRPLHHAIIGGCDSRIISQLLTRGALVNAKTNQNVTPLCLAVRVRNNDMVSLLLEHNADINVLDHDGNAALHYAIINDNVTAMKFLLSDSCVVDQQSSIGVTALMIAANNGSAQLLKELIKAGANIECRSKYSETAIHLAARNGHVKATKVLLAAGANINAQSKGGSNSLYESACRNHVNVVRVLLEEGANVNIKCSDDKTPLYTACDKGNKEIVRILLDHGADVNFSDQRNWASYHFAAQHGFLEIVKLLLEKGGWCNAQTKEGLTCLHLAYLGKYEHLAEILLQLGSRTDLLSTEGYSALHFAAAHSSRKSIFFLLARNTDLNVKSKKGYTPLHLSIMNGNREVTVELLQKGANINAVTYTGECGLHIAVSRGQTYLADMLITQGADLERETVNGNTPLIYACVRGNTGVVVRLLRAGASVNHSNNDGWTPLHFAARNGHQKVVTLLLQAKSKHLLTTSGMLPYEIAFVLGHFKISSSLASDIPISALRKKFVLFLLQIIQYSTSHKIYETLLLV